MVNLTSFTMFAVLSAFILLGFDNIWIGLFGLSGEFFLLMNLASFANISYWKSFSFLIFNFFL